MIEVVFFQDTCKQHPQIAEYKTALQNNGRGKWITSFHGP